MASLVFQLRGRSPHNGPLVIGPRALAKALNQKGGRGRPSLLRIELAPFSPRPESSARLFRRRGNDRIQDEQSHASDAVRTLHAADGRTSERITMVQGRAARSPLTMRPQA